MVATTDEKNGQVKINLSYLQIELYRIDILVRKAIRRWQIAGQNPADPFRGLYITPEEAGAIAVRPLNSNWGTEVELPAEEQAAFSAEELDARRMAEEITHQARQNKTELRLALLQKTFHLSPLEYDALLICLAPGIDTRYERLYAFLQDDISRKQPSVSLILDLLLPDDPERVRHMDCFRDQAPLLEWGLLKSPHPDAGATITLLRRELVVAPEVISWLAGTYFPADELADCIQLIQPQPVAAPLLEGTLPFPTGANPQMPLNGSPILAFSGEDELRQQSAALNLAASVGMPLLQVDLRALKAENQPLPSSLRLALRDAALNRAVPYFTGWDLLIAEDGTVSNAVLHDLAWYHGPVLVSSRAEWRVGGAGYGGGADGVSGYGEDEKPILRYPVELPGFSHRQKLWQHFLNHGSPLAGADIDLLASQFTLTSAQIQDAVTAARHAAFQQQRPIAVSDLFEAARQQSSHQLSSLAVKVHHRYTWDDIVLPENELTILKEIALTIRERPLVLDGWGLGKKLVASPGISALFAGQPGTGKTLAAQVIAEDLGMDLYKIDLSSVVSKYIGETEKNLERIFNQARNSNAILFFDEADAIFGKRSEVKDAHDRYANIEVGYLLQRMESYDGVVILATNLRSNLDDAFTRRLQFIVDFPFPDVEQRLNIWKVLFPPGAPREAQLDFETLAKRFELAGGSIRNAIVSASFQAASEGGPGGSPISTRHLLHGVRRELQKMGRLIDERDLTSVS